MGFSRKQPWFWVPALGHWWDAVKTEHSITYDQLDGFPVSGVSGHAGTLTAGILGGHKVAVLSGRSHYYEHANAAAMRPPLEALRGAGIKRLILTNSAGSTDPKMPPGSVMQIKDHINFSGSNPLFGEQTDARFVGLNFGLQQRNSKGFQTRRETARHESAQGCLYVVFRPQF